MGRRRMNKTISSLIPTPFVPSVYPLGHVASISEKVKTAAKTCFMRHAGTKREEAKKSRMKMHYKLMLYEYEMKHESNL